MRPFLSVMLVVSLVLPGCGPGEPQAELYDPPGSTSTTGRPITDQPRRTIGFRDTGVWVTNEFAGARLSDFVRTEDNVYRATIRPENAPINNSAWYGFKIWSDRPDTVTVEFVYEDGTHRYWPKLSRDGTTWKPAADAAYVADTTAGTARLRLAVGPDTTWVSAQELRTSRFFDAWTAGLAARPGVERTVIGESVRGRPIRMLAFGGGGTPEGYVLVIGRQHPPEVTGTLALVAFLETLLSDDPLAVAFRERFRVLAVPLVNPDGVDLGHWRHNAGGVDLNRDWLDFNQPEVRQVRDTFVSAVEAADVPVVFAIDFHSTQTDVFYTHVRDLETNRPGLIDAWLQAIRDGVPGYTVVDESSDLGIPLAKNWFLETFGATSVIHEVGDEQDRELLARVARTSAEALMGLLTGGPGA